MRRTTHAHTCWSEDSCTLSTSICVRVFCSVLFFLTIFFSSLLHSFSFARYLLTAILTNRTKSSANRVCGVYLTVFEQSRAHSHANNKVGMWTRECKRANDNSKSQSTAKQMCSRLAFVCRYVWVLSKTKTTTTTTNKVEGLCYTILTCRRTYFNKKYTTCSKEYGRGARIQLHVLVQSVASYTLRGINMLHVSSVRNLCTSRTYSIWRQNDAIWCTHKTFALVHGQWFCFCFLFFFLLVLHSFGCQVVLLLSSSSSSSSWVFQSTFSVHLVPLVPKCAAAVCTMDHGNRRKETANETSQIENESETVESQTERNKAFGVNNNSWKCATRKILNERRKKNIEYEFWRECITASHTFFMLHITIFTIYFACWCDQGRSCGCSVVRHRRYLANVIIMVAGASQHCASNYLYAHTLTLQAHTIAGSMHFARDLYLLCVVHANRICHDFAAERNPCKLAFKWNTTQNAQKAKWNRNIDESRSANDLQHSMQHCSCFDSVSVSISLDANFSADFQIEWRVPSTWVDCVGHLRLSLIRVTSKLFSNKEYRTIFTSLNDYTCATEDWEREKHKRRQCAYSKCHTATACVAQLKWNTAKNYLVHLESRRIFSFVFGHI